MRFAIDSNEARDVSAALTAARMNWTVGFKPLLVETADGFGTAEVASHRALVRSDNSAVVGVHGRAYTPVQNDAAFRGSLQPLLDSGLLRIVSADSWAGGSKVAITARVAGSERAITRKVGDVIGLDLTFSNSHDGSSEVSAKYGAVRLVCLNGMTAMAVSSMLRGRHTKGVHAKIEAWRLEIAEQLGLHDRTAEIFQAMAARRLSDRALTAYVRETLSEGAGADSTIVVRGVERIIELAHEAPGADPGSLWGGLNAVTYWATHERGRSDDSRAVRNLFGDGAALVARATAVATELVEHLPMLQLGRESFANHATAASEFGALLGRPARIPSEQPSA